VNEALGGAPSNPGGVEELAGPAGRAGARARVGRGEKFHHPVGEGRTSEARLDHRDRSSRGKHSRRLAAGRSGLDPLEGIGEDRETRLGGGEPGLLGGGVDAGDGQRAHLLAEQVEHRRGRLHGGNGESARGEGKREEAGARSQVDDAPRRAGQGRQPVDERRRVPGPLAIVDRQPVEDPATGFGHADGSPPHPWTLPVTLPPVPEPVVRLRSLTKRYGGFTALDRVDLDVSAGEILALLGPNGAGKTTLISIVAGIVRATSGEVRVLGRDVVADYRFTRRAIGLVPQEINFDPFFTVEETLRIQAGYFGVRLPDERLEEILEALDLGGKRHANTRSLSGGMKRRLLIGKALVHEPRVLFLDEPTAGVDVKLRQGLWAYVRRLQGRGTTIVLTTHYLEEAEELADRVAVIDKGRILLVEEKQRLLERQAGKTLRVTLTAPLAALPERLAALGARLEAGGGAFAVEVPPGGSFGPMLEAVAAAGLPIGDVETRRATLEDVFVSVLGDEERGGGA